MRLSQIQRLRITDDFIHAFQIRYGAEWQKKLSVPLRPSPIEDIACKNKVSKNQVRKIRKELLVLGQLLQILETLSQPLYSTPVLDESLYSFP